MLTETTTLFTTVDTGEAITAPSVPVDDRTGDGYDWIDTLESSVWSVLPNWGTDGWDAGAWPLIILAVTRTADAGGELFGLGVYIEGDTTTTYYRTQAAHWEAITAEVFFHWNMGQADGPENLPETVAELLGQYRRPYTARTS